LIFTSESIKNTDAVALDQDGLILCALILGGDYDSGVTGAGVAVARALAAADFGKDLVTVLKNCRGAERGRRLTVWRNRLRQELRTNSSGHLAKRQLKLLYYFDRRFRSQVTARPELNPFNFRHRSLAFGIAVFGRFPSKIHREMPKNHPKGKLNQSKGESKWSQVTMAESTVEIVQ
jgi:hypothetical protein